MKKQFILFAAALAIVGCSSNDYMGSQDPEAPHQAKEAELTFNYEMPRTYKVPTADATGSTAATKLNNQFIVWGEKTADATESYITGTVVFNNYVVAWDEVLSESNTNNWEYVGKSGLTGYNDTFKADGSVETAGNVQPNNGTKPQTTKFWDFEKPYHTFTAVSAKPADIAAGNIKIKKITPSAAGSNNETAYDKGYEITIGTGADLSALYISDRVVKNATTDNGSPVTLKFRQFATNIRFGFYETVPGYSVKITKVYYGSNTNGVSDGHFGVDGSFIAPSTSTATAKVTYYSEAAYLNQPKVSVTAAGTAASSLETRDHTNGDAACVNVTLPETSATAVYDKADFTTIYPYTNNASDLTVKIDIQLTSLDNANDVINVKGISAVVANEFCQWQPNFKYTYLFKINDKVVGTDGTTTLYPITFDAVVAENGTTGAQTTTTTFNPYGVTTYAYGANTYAVAGVGETLQKDNAAAAGYFKLYDANVIDSKTGAFTVSEASVLDAMKKAPTANVIELTANATTVTLQTTYVGGDGKDVTVGNGTATTVAKFATSGINPTGKKTVAVYLKEAGEATAATAAYDASATYYKKNDYGFYYVAAVAAEDLATSGEPAVTDWKDDAAKAKYFTAVTKQPVYWVKVLE